MTQFGPWRPDQPRIGNPCITATNVLPTANGYGPFSDTVAQTDALPAGCVGAISLKRVDGTAEVFAGTTTKLYRLSGTSWDDVSRTTGGAYTTGTFWRFTLYGSRLVATNGIDSPQAFDLGTDTDFANLPNAPVADFFIVIRDILVAIGTANDISFSAVNDSEKWTADCGGGSQPVPDGGPLVGGTGGEFGVILQERALTRMNFVGGPLRFKLDRIEGAIGCISAGSIVEYKGLTFYLSEEGFMIFNGAESQNISDEEVTDHFFDNLDYSSVADISGALDPRNSIVWWAYPTSTTTKMIGYNYRLKQWVESDKAISCLVSQVGSGANKQRLSCFDSADKLATFTGDPQSAVLSTGDLQLARDRNALVRSVRGLVDGDFEIRIGKKYTPADTEQVFKKKSKNGKSDLLVDARFHRIELRPSGTTWTEVSGFEIEAVPSGQRY